MHLLARTLRQFRQLVGNNAWFTALTVVVLLCLELAGRHTTTSDWHDAALAAVLGALLYWVVHQNNRSPLPWLRPVGSALRAVGDWVKQWLVEVGYDLRGDPPVRRGLPPLAFAVGGVLLGWGLILLAFGDYFPQALRVFGVNYFYLGYLAVMALLWGAIVIGIFGTFYFAVGLVHDELASDGRSPRLSRAALSLALLSVILLAGRLVPLWQALSACLLAWVLVSVISLTSGPSDIRFLWRPRHSIRVRSVSGPRSDAILIGLCTALALDLVVTAAGSLVWKDPLVAAKTDMRLTLMLGTALGWSLAVLMWVFVWQAAKGRVRLPARPGRRVLHVRGAAPLAVRRLLRRHFSRWQWRLDYGSRRPDACAAQIEIVEPVLSQAREFDPVWPLKVSLAHLDDEQVRGRIERRSDIQVRRRLVSGLERIFRVAKRRRYRNGHGYWVAPHLPLWNGLRRDEPEPDLLTADGHMVHDNVGPAYHRVLPHLARHAAYRMFRGLQIDLIFVEDGVTFRRFAKVLRRIFELFDKQPSRPVQDQHFVGLTGTKVMIYEFQFDNPFESETYPEPKFTALGRARILLVFRDRSESEELLETPFDTTRTPAPVGRSQ